MNGAASRVRLPAADHLGLALRVAHSKGYVPDPVWSREDLEQEAVVGLLLALRSYDPAKSKVGTWAWSQVAWHLQDCMRRGGRRDSRVTSIAPLDDTNESGIDDDAYTQPEACLDVRASDEWTQQMLASINPRDAEAIRLVCLLGLSQKSAGQRMGVHESRVNQRIHRGLDRLRRQHIEER